MFLLLSLVIKSSQFFLNVVLGIPPTCNRSGHQAESKIANEICHIYIKPHIKFENNPFIGRPDNCDKTWTDGQGYSNIQSTDWAGIVHYIIGNDNIIPSPLIKTWDNFKIFCEHFTEIINQDPKSILFKPHCVYAPFI